MIRKQLVQPIKLLDNNFDINTFIPVINNKDQLKLVVQKSISSNWSVVPITLNSQGTQDKENSS